MSRFLSILIALAVVAAACGNDSDGDSPAASDVVETDSSPSTTDAPDTTTQPTTEPPAPTAPLPLSDALCDDPDTMATLLESPDTDAALSSAEFDADQIERMAAAPTDGPIYLVTVSTYRDVADYTDGRDSDLTGREAAELHDPTELMTAVGARSVYEAEPHNQIDGDDTVWESITIAEYPCPTAYLAVATHPDYQADVIHETAGVEESITVVADLLPIPAPSDPDQADAAFPPTAEDPAFDMIHLMDFHDIAQYEPDADEPERSGEEAWQQYQASGSGASVELGHHPTAILDVQGVLTGDDRSWDQIQMIHMSSTAGFEALLDDSTRQDGRYHRYAALENHSSRMTDPDISQIPSAGPPTQPAADAGEEEALGAEAGDANTGELTAFLAAAPENDDAFHMVNLIRFRDTAEYPDGRDTDLTGREADAIYGEFMSTTMLPTTGAEIVYSASVPATESFDTVAIVRYPSRAAFQAMIDDPQFQEMSIHKQAGVAETIVLATDLISLGDVTSGEMVLHLIGPADAGATIPGERAAFEVAATINGHVDTFAEVRIGTADIDGALVSVTHQPLADLLDESE
ncbi:MAG: hypothetical protein AAF081_19595 [Actinomycetota bacterium]